MRLLSPPETQLGSFWTAVRAAAEGGLQQLDCQPLLQGGRADRPSWDWFGVWAGIDAPCTCLPLSSSRLSTGGDAGRTNAAGRLSSDSCVAETVAVVSYSLLSMLVQVCKGKRDKLVIFYIVVQLIFAHVGHTISITTTIELPNCPFCPAMLSYVSCLFSAMSWPIFIL